MYLFSGGGPAFGAALFGAAKVKECSPDHAIAIPLEEFHHYNSQKHGEPLFLVAPEGRSVSRARDTALEGRRWGGTIYAVTTEGDHTLDDCTDEIVALPPVPEALAPLVYTVPLQLFAYHVAQAKFRLAEAAAKG
jgi:glucosamine--fructose-6-phosphate aminotransferase (isomerizing)